MRHTNPLHLLLAILICFQAINQCSAQTLPIKPTRTIAFDTDEGTNMDVDISPDGRTLLFDLLGDLYSVPSVGGRATQLTRGLALNFLPIWSPDGKKIAYLSDFSGCLHLNVRDIEGKFHTVLGRSEPQLTYYNICPVWTPDGNYIAVDDKIYGLGGANRGSESPIQNLLRFSTDGKMAYYLDSGNIYKYHRVTKTTTAISAIAIGLQNLALSPDGRWLAYITDSNSKKCLVLRDLTRNTDRILVPSLFLKYPFYRVLINQHFAFSSDSKNLFIGYGGKIHRIDIMSNVDSIIPFYAAVKVDLGPLDYNEFHVPEDSVMVKYTRSANASPDGKHLVFSALDRIYVMDLPNGKPHLISPQSIGQFQPIYSPDGQWIAYVSWCDTVGGFLWRVRSSGGQPQQLTKIAGQYQRPAWSPDGSLIAIIKGEPHLGDRDDPGIGKLELIAVNGGAVRVIDDTVRLWNQLSFSPDGKKVIYEPMNEEYGKQFLLLVSKSLDGSGAKILAMGNLKCRPEWLQQRALSPDGRYIVYSMGEDLYLVPICQIIGATNLFNSNQNLTLIRFSQGVDPNWEKGGKILSWSYSNRFYRVDPNKIMAEARLKQASLSADTDIVSISVHPDQIVFMRLTVPQMHAAGTIVLKNVRIITMQGNKVIENGTIVIKNGRFLAIGPSDRTAIPSGSKILDLPGTTVMPGFVDTHLHMRTPPEIFPQQSWLFLINLAYGVTTARDPSTSLGSFGYQELLRSGQMIGPRLYPSGRVMDLYTQGIFSLKTIQDMQINVRKRALFSGTLIKQYTLPTRLQRQYLLIASKEARMNMTNEGEYLPIFDIGMIKDGSTGVEHSPWWGDVYKDISTFIVKAGSYWTPTLQVRYSQTLTREYSNYLYWHKPDSKLKHFTPPAVLNTILSPRLGDTTDEGLIYPSVIAALIRRQGGHVALGSHGNDEGIGVHNELWALQMGGLSNLEALQCATIIGAEALGIQKDVGSIEVGKIADLIILNKNPLQDIHNSREIRYVMKDGILYDGNTLDAIWPSFKKCPEWNLK